MSVFIQKAPNLIDIINKNRDNIEDILNKINSIYNNIDLLDNVVSAPLISYPSQAIYGSTVTLKASSSITAFKDNGAILDTYIWELPDNSIVEGDTITYTMPDNSHIGETITIKCRAKDILGNYSKYSNIDISVTNIDDTPIIDSISWDENNHMAGDNYTLTINAHDPNGDNLTYELIAIDDNITISQDTTNSNQFHVTYPGYPMDIVINYTIKVTDTHNATATFIENKLVHYVNHAPIIDNVTWNNSNHYENGSYVLTINAHDTDLGDILTYNVICSDFNVTIVQDSTNPNIFYITYPEYALDTTVIYNITVTDHDGLSATLSLNQLVQNINHPPVIDSTSWDDSNHYENGSYTLTITAHDPDSGDSIDSYAVTCDDTNVTVTQDATNPNIFTVSYPEYTNDVTVTYTITVTDNHGDSTNTILTQLVQNINHPPIIDSTFWDDSNHYENGSYTLTINAHDPDSGDSVDDYSVTCSDSNVTITQDATNPNVFHVTYPEYINDVTVTYTITVTDNFGATDSTIITQLVHNINHDPIIDNIAWDDSNHYENGSYILTITAHDPDIGDSVNSYNVTCSDFNVTVTQDITNPNIFHITYPEYTNDTIVIYTVTVTDSFGDSATITLTQTVQNINHLPIIDNTSWDDDTHYENGSYTLTITAHDPDVGDTITYSVSCDDTNVSITQDAINLNIFHIDYPEYTNDVTVTYTITVTDTFGATDSTTITKLVQNINHPPVIDSTVWDDSNHYENGSYTLIITAHDPDVGDTITYSVTCDDTNVTITQDVTNLNQFHVTYPEYTIDTIVTYTVTVTDSFGDNTVTTLSQLVHNNNHLPIIDNVTWDDDDHYENGSYTLTITAHDPDSGDSINNYNVICSDTNVTVTQDATNPNIFTVTYPEYTNDVTVTYIITVTDSFGAIDNITTTKLVHNINHPPVIDSTSWDNTNHYENGSYTLTINAHDPDSGDSVDSYNVTCDDTNVTITQDATNPNIFHIDYPEYTNDVTVTYTITVTDSFGATDTIITTQLVHNINHDPIIDSTSWDDSNHYENGSYTLTITAHDPDVGDTITYSVSCDDTNVTITQDVTNLNVFHVTYPEYTIDTTVTYTITVTDSFGATDSTTLTQLVHNDNHPPVIDSTSWDDNNHYENGSYVLTINAHDPDSGDNIDSYNVTCSDSNVTVTQDATNPNIFTVDYPEYTNDVTVTYTVTVSDTFGATDSTTLTQLVHNDNHAPIIDSTTWDDSNHYENGSYTLTITAHDPDSGDTLSYAVTCSDTNVTVTQDATNPNVFTVTYPEYTNDVTVTYTITVTDSFGATDSTILTQLVHNDNHAPIIDSTTWDDSNHYENGSYTLTINAHDPDIGDSVSYNVTCNDINVIVTQDVTNPNIFHIDYPEYTNDVTVTYTVTVTDSFGAIDNTTLTQLVHNINHSPIIDSTIWDDNNHYENGSYTLTINAHDPDSGDSIDSYDVSCDDINVSIMQDGANPNIFYIDYPEYDNDVTVTYTITVTDSFGATDSTITTQLVYNDNHAPVIDSTSWDDSNHYENGSYTLTITAHDPDSGDSVDSYAVTCDDSNVTITQDNTYPNQFHVTYPEYTNDVTVTYTITVTDSFGATDTIITTQLVHNDNHAPVIDSTTWDDDTHYGQGSYVLTINAHDPDVGDIITYTVTCDDTNVTVTQDNTNPNQFHVTYPNYSFDVTVTYTITVTDTFGATDSTTLTQSVYKRIGNRGVFGGGFNGSVNFKTIDYINIPILSNAQYFGELTVSKRDHGGTSNGTNDRGVFAGGHIGNSSSLSNIIDYITISTLGDALDFGDLTETKCGLVATSNGTNNRGVFGGGDKNNFLNTIEYITISTLGDAQDFGDLTTNKAWLSATSNGTNDRGIFGGGYNNLNIIDYITISTLGDAIDFGDLTVSRRNLAATSNSTNNRGVFAGGYSNDNVNTIDYITITTLGDAIDFGDLTIARRDHKGTSNGTNERGVFGGGEKNNFLNTIDYITISTLGDAQDFGDLTIIRDWARAISDA